MSAPTALDAGALITGLAWTVRPPQTIDESPGADFSGDEQRSKTRIAELTREHNDLCTQAVDPFEIAAGLEAAGLSDRQARTYYGAASVFELAEAMYGLVPRRTSNAVAPIDPWSRPVRRHLLRGLLYALPGLMYALALVMLQSGFDAILLLGTTIVAAGLGQGLSLLGHVLIGRGQQGAAGAMFRSALVFAGILGFAILLTGWISGTLTSAVMVAGFQVAYLLAATILIVVEAALLLLTVLAPGVILAVLELSGATAIRSEIAFGILALCVAGAVVAAWTRLAATPRETVTHLREGFGLARYEYSMGSGYFAYGIATAGLVAFGVVDALTRHGNPAEGPIALMMLPLVGSLGVAEWQVYRLRSRALMALRETTSVKRFRVLARSELAYAVLNYGAVLAVLSATVIVAFPQQPPLPFILSTCAYGVLGLAFFCATLLLSLGRYRLALGLSITALIVDSALRWAFASASPEALAGLHLMVFLVLLAVILPAAASQFSYAGAHR
ncbi:hypothetical protein [Demequina aurantiaca]|uniref:hypothetical protein n=1 Tax=Demequina aurantiaca TaxID=676200 RepID=UPI003D3461B5